MKKIILKEVIEDPKEFVKQPAEVKHGEALIDSEFIGVDEDGIVQLVYIKLPDIKETKMYKALVKKLQYNTTQRVSGMVTTSTIFGYAPPVEMRQKPFCSSTKLAEELPKENRFLSYYCEKHIMPLFEKHYAHNLAEHRAVMKKLKVKKDWIMKGTIFSGGVINKANQLNYHIDIQNIKGSINAMVYFAREMDGGELVVPKYNARIQPLDNHVLLFRNDLVHGVAPLLPKNKDAYRYSIVYYLNNRIQNCGTLSEELAKARG